MAFALARHSSSRKRSVRRVDPKSGDPLATPSTPPFTPAATDAVFSDFIRVRLAKKPRRAGR